MLVVVVLALTLAAVGYVLHDRASLRAAAAAAPQVHGLDVRAVAAVPHLVFRSTAPDATYGTVGLVPLSDPSGPRAVTDVPCDRIDATGARYLCLSADRGVVTTYAAQVLDATLARVRALPLSGIPNRARLSRDGRLAATTTFVSGDSYAASSFSTRTVITDVASGATADLEDFALVVDGARTTASDRNLWGVTFASDDDTFYATAATAGRTHLVRGHRSSHRLDALHDDAECPSLSPDGRTIVYKKRLGGPPGHWRLTAYDLASGAERLLAETRSVDDQVEWLDDTHVVYGLPRSGADTSDTDVWVVPSDGTGAPAVLAPHAFSPAVVP